MSSAVFSVCVPF